MDFGEVLSKAWKIIWKHKILWIFGILAGCGGGTSSNAGSRFNYQSNEFPQVQSFIDRVSIWAWLLVILAVILLVIIIILLGTVGRIGLIKGTLQAEDGAVSLYFGKLFNESLHFFWRVFGFYLLIAIAAIILVLVTVLPVVILGIG